EIPGHARNCVFWMVNPDPDSPPVVDPGFEVEAWLSMVMLEWGACGSIAWHDGHPVGHAVYAPPTMIPRAGLFPTSPRQRRRDPPCDDIGRSGTARRRFRIRRIVRIGPSRPVAPRGARRRGVRVSPIARG